MLFCRGLLIYGNAQKEAKGKEPCNKMNTEVTEGRKRGPRRKSVLGARKANV
jgi:hypothetical protein